MIMGTTRREGGAGPAVIVAGAHTLMGSDRGRWMRGTVMARNPGVVVGGIALGILLLIVLPIPFWLVALVLIGVPVAGYLMLDPSQRRRLKDRRRRQLGP